MAGDVMAIRLDRTLRGRLARAAKRRRLTPSAAARRALEDWLLAEEGEEAARPYEAIADLLGSTAGRRLDLPGSTGGRRPGRPSPPRRRR